MNVIMIVVMMILNDAGAVEQGKAYALSQFANVAACEEKVKEYNHSARRLRVERPDMKNFYTIAYCEGDV